MSTEELVLKSCAFEIKIMVSKISKMIAFEAESSNFVLSREQAHLLMLYLQEHLK